MPTDKQRDANKRNAQKSTGPRTDEGKRKSSLNGLRHGLFAKTMAMTPDEEIDHARLLESYLDHFRPEDPITLDLVEELAMAKMRQKRAWRIEADLLRIEIDRQREHTAKQFPGEKIEGHMALAYEWLVDESVSIVTIRRHEAQLHRAWHKCLNQLERRLPPNPTHNLDESTGFDRAGRGTERSAADLQSEPNSEQSQSHESFPAESLDDSVAPSGLAALPAGAHEQTQRPVSHMQAYAGMPIPPCAPVS